MCWEESLFVLDRYPQSHFTRLIYFNFFAFVVQLHFVGHCSLPRRTASDKTGANSMTEAWLIDHERPIENALKAKKDSTRKLYFDATLMLRREFRFSTDLWQIGTITTRPGTRHTLD